MAEDLLRTSEAAQRLGVSTSRFYEWLGLSDRGQFVIRGQPVTINYFQGGAKGQGRIRITTTEVDRLVELSRVRPSSSVVRRPSASVLLFPGITVELGRPNDAVRK